MRKNFFSKNLFLIVVFVFLFLLKSPIFAVSVYSNQIQIKENSEKILNLENDLNLVDERIKDIKENNQKLYDGVKDQNQILGHQISFTNYILAFFSLLITIGGILLGIYIQKQYKKIEKAKNIIKKTKDFINGHNIELYKKLKREETISLLKRLEEVPEDICNICMLLLSRDLQDEDFYTLKNAFLKAKNILPIDEEYMYGYKALFLQNFTYYSFNDSEIKDEVINSIDKYSINGMFERDLQKFFVDITRYIQEKSLEDIDVQNIIQKFLNSLYSSKYKDKINNLLVLLKDKKIDLQCFYKIASEKRLTEDNYLNWLKDFKK